MVITTAMARKTLREARRVLADFERMGCYTAQQAAEFLGKTEGTLALWRREGVGPPWHSHSNGKNVLYPFDPLVDWLVDQCGRRHRFTRLDRIHDAGYVTEREAATMLFISSTTMRDWRRKGWVVPAFRAPARFNLGGQMHFYRRDAIEQLMPRLQDRQGLGRGMGTTRLLAPENADSLDDL